MKNHLNQELNIYYFSFFTLAFSMLFFGTITMVSAEETKNSNSQILKKSITNPQTITTKLIPMPIGDFESASKRVDINRNPFQDPAKSEITNIDNLYSALKFKGVALSGNKLSAIIKTDDVQKFYEVGDKMDNGFTINSISYKDISVDVSNGSKKYRLTLSKFKNLL